MSAHPGHDAHHGADHSVVVARHASRRGRVLSGPATTTSLVVWVLAALLLLGAGAVATGAVQLTAPGAGPTAAAEGSDDGTWSFYHDRDYDTVDTSAKWESDRSRSSDPDEAVLGETSRWEYDGPYRYGPYGSDGMRRRASGRESADPLYSQPTPVQDVFSAYGGDLDPSGGMPVGVVPSSLTNPYFDPYAGYSNPYANRIRMAYGEGYGRGALFEPAAP